MNVFVFLQTQSNEKTFSFQDGVLVDSSPQVAGGTQLPHNSQVCIDIFSNIDSEM